MTTQADDAGLYRFDGIDVGSQNTPTDLVITADAPGFDPVTRSIQVFCGAVVSVGEIGGGTGTIVINKQTDPPGDPTSFGFSADFAPDGFSLADGEQYESDALEPGTYTVTEDDTPGWQLTDAMCDDGSDPGQIELQAGETVTCTFTNTRLETGTGTIVINKQTDPPGDPTSFGFSADFAPDGFSLADGEQYEVGCPRTRHLHGHGGRHARAGQLLDAMCDDGSDPGQIELQAGETVTCTFTNTRLGSITIEKVTDPATDPRDFAYTTSGTGLSDFSLDTDPSDPSLADSVTFGDLLPGQYVVTEDLPIEGWDLEGVRCRSTLGTSDLPASTTSAVVDIALAAGDDVTCVYDNTKRATVAIAKTVLGGPPSGGQSFDFQVRRDASPNATGTVLGAGTADAANGDLVTLHDAQSPGSTLYLVPGTYQVCEFIVPGWANPFGSGSFVPGLANDSTIDNAYQCVDIALTVGESRTIALDNTPPPGGMGKTIGFWKNWSSCARSNGHQAPVLDQTLGLGDITVGVLLLHDHDQDPEVASDCLAANLLLDKRRIDTNKKMASDPAFNFAAQYLAYRLNLAAGADRTCAIANDAGAHGQALLATFRFDGRTHGKIDKRSAADLARFESLLDAYNNNTLACGASGS